MNNTQEKVYDSADVLVVGGGFGGVCAALAAAKTGVSVILVERSANLGGQAAEIHTWGVDGFISSTGKQLIRGFPWEILQKTVAEGGSDPVWSLIDMKLLEKEGIAAALEDLGYKDMIPYSAVLDANNPFNNNYINPNAYRYVCHTLLAEAGVRLYLESPVVGTFMEDNIIKGVEIATPYGKRLLGAKRIVDTSQNAVVCTYAGESFTASNIYMGSHIQCAGVDINKMLEYIRNTDEVWRVRPMLERPTNADELQRMVDQGCTVFMDGFATALKKAAEEKERYACLLEDLPIMILLEHNGLASPFVKVITRPIDLSDTAQYSSIISYTRRKQWLYYTFFRDYVPGCEKMILMDTCPHIPKAHIGYKTNLSSRFLTLGEIKSGQLKDGEEGIVIVRGHPGANRDEGWRIPLETLIAKDYENLLITGKPACQSIHYIATCAAVGQAAGASAALSASTDIPLREMDTALIRKELASERQNFAWKE